MTLTVHVLVLYLGVIYYASTRHDQSVYQNWV